MCSATNTYYICATGPSLDVGVERGLDPLKTIAVNFACAALPLSRFVAAIDVVDAVTPYYQPHQCRVVTSHTLNTARNRGADIYDRSLLVVGDCRGSSEAAIHGALALGADRIETYGIGGEGRARCVEEYYRDVDSQPGAVSVYGEYLKNCINILDESGVDYVIH